MKIGFPLKSKLPKIVINWLLNGPIFDRLFLGFFVFLGITFFLFFFQSTNYIKVNVRITDRDVIYAIYNPPAWYAYLLKKGLQEKNYLGQIMAEIENVNFYDALGETNVVPAKKTVYLTVKLKSKLNKKTGKYNYKGTELVSGEVLRINFGSVLVNGLITDVEGQKDNYPVVYAKVKFRVKNNNPLFLNTTGIDQYVSDALFIGNRVINSQGDIQAEIIDKLVQAAEVSTVDYQGVSRNSLHPRKKDVYLTLKIKLNKIGNELFYFNDYILKVDSYLPLTFPNVTIYAAVTDFIVLNEN